MEAEVMTHEDYDFIIANGWKKFINKYLPRVINMMEFIPSMMWLGFNTPRIQREHEGWICRCLRLGFTNANNTL
jgi:hypothetical protein